MIEILPELQSRLTELYWHGFAVFLRVAALSSLLPAFGERTVPMRIKLVIALMFTMIVAPAVPMISQPADLVVLGLLVLSETIVGLALGIAIRLFVLALQTAGSIAAQATSLAQILGGAAVEPIPAIGYVLVIAGLALAVMSGLHVQAAEYLIYSYEIFPVGEFPTASILAEWGISRISHAFSLAFALAAPFVIISLIYNLTLGVINRAMPQLMVAFVGAPVITFGGLFLLFVCSPMLLQIWADSIASFFANPMEITR